MRLAPSGGIAVIGFLFLAGCGDGGPKPSPKSGMPMAGMHGDASSAQTTSPLDPRAALFLEKGCPQCHSISALGVKSPTEVGPDLTIAYSDVQSRFNMKLDEFLKNPTGTMQIVLSSQIKLSPAERDSIIEILEDLQEEAEADDNDK
jgi:cytochrome c551/c552